MTSLEPWPSLNHRIIGVEKKSYKNHHWPKGGSTVTELFLTAAPPSYSQRPTVMETFQLPKIIPPRL